MTQALIVKMHAQIRLELGAVLLFVPNLQLPTDEPFHTFQVLVRTYEGQECRVVGLPDLRRVIPAAENETDDAEAEIFAAQQRFEAKAPRISVQFSDGAIHQIRLWHFIALGARDTLCGSTNTMLRSYSATPDASQIAAATAAGAVARA